MFKSFICWIELLIYGICLTQNNKIQEIFSANLLHIGYYIVLILLFLLELYLYRNTGEKSFKRTSVPISVLLAYNKFVLYCYIDCLIAALAFALLLISAWLRKECSFRKKGKSILWGCSSSLCFEVLMVYYVLTLHP